MCGILGIFSADGKAADERARPALDRLHHRGPDGSGEWTSPRALAWLGHRRLAIIDLSERGLQPLANEDGSLQLVCNGEIYNYPRLREELERDGHRFRSDSDSEVILHAYEAWGKKCLDRLEGMFAFLLWDERRGRLFAARDRVGIKPLYYADRGGTLYCASEAGALAALLPERPEPDPRAIAHIMTLGYVPAPLSIWKGIRKLEPGQRLVWDRTEATPKVKRYWSPPKDVAEETAPAEPFEDLFSDVLRDHLLADVPIGLFLSGGMDSTSVAVGLREIHQPLHAFTVSFPGHREDEGPIAGETARYLGFPHTDIPLTVGDVDTLMRQVAAAYDEPQGYSALLSMYLLCRRVAAEYKAVMAGDGGDEAFGGYVWYRDLEPPRRALFNRLLGRVGGLMPGRNGALPNAGAVDRFISRSALHAHAWRLYPRFLPGEAEALLAPTGLRFHEDDAIEPLERHYVRSLPLKRALQRVDLMTFCSDSILAKVDRASMAFSLEVRVPFLDRRIVEYGLTRPLDSRESTINKPVLADYLRDRVPPQLLNRPKQGFSLRVLDNYDWNAALETIRRSWWVEEGFLDPKWEAILGPVTPQTAPRIWIWTMLSRWADAWIRGEAPATTASSLTSGNE